MMRIALMIAILAACGRSKDPPCSMLTERSEHGCELACNKGDAEACEDGGDFYATPYKAIDAKGVVTSHGPPDPAKGRELWKKGCDLGHKRSCDMVEDYDKKQRMK